MLGKKWGKAVLLWISMAKRSCLIVGCIWVIMTTAVIRTFPLFPSLATIIILCPVSSSLICTTVDLSSLQSLIIFVPTFWLYFLYNEMMFKMCSKHIFPLHRRCLVKYINMFTFCFFLISILLSCYCNLVAAHMITWQFFFWFW